MARTAMVTMVTRSRQASQGLRSEWPAALPWHITVIKNADALEAAVAATATDAVALH